MKSNLRIQRAKLARKEAVVFLWFALFLLQCCHRVHVSRSAAGRRPIHCVFVYLPLDVAGTAAVAVHVVSTRRCVWTRGAPKRKLGQSERTSEVAATDWMKRSYCGAS